MYAIRSYYEPVGRAALGFRLVGQQDAMTQDIVRDRLHVLRHDIVTTRQPGAGTRAAVQRQRCPRAGTEAQPAGEFIGVGRGPARRHDLV